MPAGVNPSDIDMMARTMWAENENASPQEYAAIAHVMRNRLLSRDPQYGGNTMSQILLAKNQFTPWSTPKASNYPMNVTQRDPAYQSAYRIASDVMTGNIPDSTNGAVNYHASDMKRRPSWAAGREGQTVGGHTFYAAAAKTQPDYSDLLSAEAPSTQPAQTAGLSSEVATKGKPTPQPEYSDLLTGDEALPVKEAPETQRNEIPQSTIPEAIPMPGENISVSPGMAETYSWAKQHPTRAAAAGAGIPLALGAAAIGPAAASAAWPIIKYLAPWAAGAEYLNHGENVFKLIKWLRGATS